MNQARAFFARLGNVLRTFFFPPPGASRFRKLLPYGLLGLLTLMFLTAGAYGWEYTNSPVFCGATCHTMPPEYSAYQVSPHARVACVDCHIGKGFIATRITRKAGDIKHVTATLFTSYEYPIFAGEMRPARETCELCHYPAKFSDDSLREIVHFAEDEANTRTSTFLALRTGGGSRREGLGRGIHWHVENEVWFVAADPLQQDIPYVRVIGPDGDEQVYVALDSSLSADELAAMPQERMDCITCHNRITHNILSPDRAVDLALARRQIDVAIPYIRREAVRVLSGEYATDEEAHQAIRDLAAFYADEYPDFYAENREAVERAIAALMAIQDDSNFRDQQVNWQTHPNNVGHRDWPGCFRCHDGQHVNAQGQAIRLECNLCHSIPEVVAEGVIEPVLPLASGIQPESHFSTHWIAQHRFAFDQTCQACHTVSNPGGADNTSFCSNSACHGSEWRFAGLNAPGLSALIGAPPEPSAQAAREPDETDDQDMYPATGATPQPTPEAGATPEPAMSGDLTWSGSIGVLFAERCTGCHGAGIATGGLVLDTYDEAMAGGASGPVILPGDAQGSPLVQRQREGHFGRFTPEELELVIEWIAQGAPEN